MSYDEICEICGKPIYSLEDCEHYLADIDDLTIKRGHKDCMKEWHNICYEWAKKIMDTFPKINEIITESKLREMGMQLLCKQKNEEVG